jgi:sirohydrochlorin cobaltochelatase
MIESTLVLAAHGSRSDAEVNDCVLLMARRAAGLAGFDLGVAAFHQGAPHFSVVLDQHPCERAVVVPFMTSNGYYCDAVLPRELARNTRARRTMTHITPPVGQHPALIPLVEARAMRVLGEHGVSPTVTTLVIVGHGTRRHPKSRESAEDLATMIATRGGFAEVITAFLDEDPRVETIPGRASFSNILVEPFLINDAHHALVDVPERLGLSPGSLADAGTPSKSGKLILCDSAVGTDETILGIIIALAIQGRAALDRRAAGAA